MPPLFPPQKENRSPRFSPWTTRISPFIAARASASFVFYPPIGPSRAKIRRLLRTLFLNSKYLIDLSRQRKIVITDPLHAVRVQIDHHFVPHVEPFRMMVHRLRHQRHPRHVPKRRHKILALELPVQFPIHQAPALRLFQPFLYFTVCQFLSRHARLQIASLASIMRCVLIASNRTANCERSRFLVRVALKRTRPCIPASYTRILKP